MKQALGLLIEWWHQGAGAALMGVWGWGRPLNGRMHGRAGLIAGLKPISLITTATPHLGVRGLIPKVILLASHDGNASPGRPRPHPRPHLTPLLGVRGFIPKVSFPRSGRLGVRGLIPKVRNQIDVSQPLHLTNRHANRY